jgi:dienelactone hydrolase
MKKHKKAYRIIKYLLIAILLSSVALVPAILFPAHNPLEPTGPYDVGMATIELEDTHRIEEYKANEEDNSNRILSVDYYFPKNATGKFPLILFSHGAFGVKSSNESLYLEMASHGYVVGAIGHTYQSLFTNIDGHLVTMDREYMHEVIREDAHKDKAQSYRYYQKWMKTRTEDIRFVMNYTIAKSDFNEMVDSKRIGVMGHSVGGSAALGVGRMCEGVGAVVALESPFLCDILGVSNDEFILDEREYPVPVLNVYTDSSWGKMAKWPQYGTNNLMLKEESGKIQNVHISGAGHFSITDLALSSPGLARILDGNKTTVDAAVLVKMVNQITLTFFDRHLKGIS